MQFKRIEEIESLPANTMLDVVGILESAGDFVTLTLKNATEQTKRSIVLRDNSDRSIELTLWGEFASNPGDQLAQVSTSMHSCIQGPTPSHSFALCMLCPGMAPVHHNALSHVTKIPLSSFMSAPYDHACMGCA